MASENSAADLLGGVRPLGLPGVILAGLIRAIPCVCTIENAGSSNGTGFLIAPDLVLTNHHVVSKLLIPGVDLSGVECRFDYLDPPAGGVAPKGVFAGVAGVLVSSEPSEADGSAGVGAFDRSKLDYAIIRLDQQVGRQKLPDGRQRGWFPLPQRSVTVDKGSRLVLLQHPEGDGFQGPLQPLRWDTTDIEDVIAERRRFVHGGWTRHGSSGSPCFATEKGFEIVAIHNGKRPPGEDPARKRGQAVAIEWIVDHIERTYAAQGRSADFIGLQPPVPPVRSKAERDRLVAQTYEAATCLMDRFAEESRLTTAIEPSPAAGGTPAPRPLVNVFVGQERDLPEELFTRLKYVSFGGRNAGSPTRWIDALKDGLPFGSGGVCTGIWPDRLGNVPSRKALLNTIIDNFDPARQHAIVIQRTIEDGWAVEAERDLLRYFADRLAEKWPGSPEVRAVVIFKASDDVDGDALALAFASLWIEQDAPPGFGFCQRLSAVMRDDLLEWRDHLDAVWGGSVSFRQAFGRLPARTRQPLKASLDSLAESLTAYIDEWLDRTPPTAGGPGS